MKPLRWICLASFVLSLNGCAPEASNPNDPDTIKAVKDRTDRIEQYKKKTPGSSKPARRPG